MTSRLKTILYVDDEPDIRAIVQTALELTPGLEVRTAACGEEALAQAGSLRPDLILLDVMMPALDGPGTLTRLRANASLAAIPVIFMTAKAMPEEIERLRRMGAIGVIGKPFDPMQLSEQVRALWRARHPASDPQQPAQPHSAADRAGVEDQRTSLAAKFLARTRGEMTTLRELIAQWQAGAQSALPQIEHLVHRIRGTGATLGFDQVSDCAGELEHAARQSSAPPPLQRLQELAERLAREIEAAAARA